MANFRSGADVQAWVDQNGVDALRDAITYERFSKVSAHVASEWLTHHRQTQEEKFAAEGRALEYRAIVATERSADAAVESAHHAGESARWARWSILVAAVALVATAWPYIRDVGRPSTPSASSTCH